MPRHNGWVTLSLLEHGRILTALLNQSIKEIVQQGYISTALMGIRMLHSCHVSAALISKSNVEACRIHVSHQ